MKLYRFTASSNHKAILRVHEALGPEALIYSTSSIPDGVEILAGLEQEPETALSEKLYVEKPLSNTVPAQHSKTEPAAMESLNNQLRAIEANIQKLSGHMNILFQVIADNVKKEKHSRWNLLKNIGRNRKNTKEGIYGRQSAY